MANSTQPLTNTEVKQARPKAKEYNLADGRGLFLRVKPSGSKLWLFNYFKPFTKRRTNISIGAYPEWTLQRARDKRDKYLELLAQEIDPKEWREEDERKNQVAHLNTLEAVARDWLALKASSVSESYLGRMTNALELYIFPPLGRRPVHKINAPEAIEILRPLAKRGVLESVKKLCRWLNEIMTYAVHTGLIQSNPLISIGKAFPNPQSESMPSIHPDELPGFMRTLLTAENITANTRNLILLQLHTMVRPGEAAGIARAEVDKKAAVWEIELSRMKKRRVHKVPLSRQVLAILDEMDEISGNRGYYFPSFKYPDRPTHSETANKALRRIGMRDQLVAHGMRSIASTVLNEKGFDPELVEISLSHVNKDRIRAAYNKAEHLQRRRELLQWWSDYIDEAARKGAEADE